MGIEGAQARPTAKRPHPTVSELVLGADLSPRSIRARGPSLLSDLLTNAEYWLSFELSHFEPLLRCSPTPIREIAVGIVLRYGEGVDGRLELDHLEGAARDLASGLDEATARGLAAAVTTLRAAVGARDAIVTLEQEGFSRFVASTALSVHGLRAGGNANVYRDDDPVEDRAELPLGAPLYLRATDERGRALSAPELESETGAPIWAKPPTKDGRAYLLVVPGRYRLKVPGRAEAHRSVVAR